MRNFYFSYLFQNFFSLRKLVNFCVYTNYFNIYSFQSSLYLYKLLYAISQTLRVSSNNSIQNNVFLELMLKIRCQRNQNHVCCLPIYNFQLKTFVKVRKQYTLLLFQHIILVHTHIVLYRRM